MEAFVQLRYKNPTEDQNKAISEFVKRQDVFVSFLLEKASLCAMPHFPWFLITYVKTMGGLEVGDVMESLYACRPCFFSLVGKGFRLEKAWSASVQ